MMRLASYIPGSRPWRRRRDMRLCARTRDRIHELADGEVPDAREREMLTRHLEACVRCGAAVEEVKALKQAIARVGRNEDPQVVGRLQDLARRLCEGTEPVPDQD